MGQGAQQPGSTKRLMRGVESSGRSDSTQAVRKARILLIQRLFIQYGTLYTNIGMSLTYVGTICEYYERREQSVHIIRVFVVCGQDRGFFLSLFFLKFQLKGILVPKFSLGFIIIRHLAVLSVTKK